MIRPRRGELWRLDDGSVVVIVQRDVLNDEQKERFDRHVERRRHGRRHGKREAADKT